MEFLLQLMAELFGGETIQETERVTLIQEEPTIEIAEKINPEIEEEANIFGVIQFL